MIKVTIMTTCWSLPFPYSKVCILFMDLNLIYPWEAFIPKVNVSTAGTQLEFTILSCSTPTV